jgi:probable rRNA maturation factor
VHLNYIFCDDAYLLVLNQRYLEHDTLTDVITFDLGEEGSGKLEGEIYISTERVHDNAAQFGAPYADELLRVVFHGMLHLCGYKDKSPEDAAAMRAEEDQCIANYKKTLG